MIGANMISLRKRAITFATLVVAASAAGCVSAPHMAARDACPLSPLSTGDALVRMPFEIVHGRVYVLAKVNGTGPHRFAVDTGASGFGRADTTLTSELGLKVVAKTETSDGINKASVDVVRLDSLSLPGLERTDLEVITRDYNRGAPPGAAIAGIIGRGFFADGLLVIDYPSRTLSFSRSRTLTREAVGALRYERPFRVPVFIGDLETVGHLDTGASVTLVLPRSLYDKVIASPLEPAGQGNLTNTTIKADRAVVRGPFRIGGGVLSDVEVRVSDTFPELLVGGLALQNFVLAIDQRSKAVAICEGKN